MNDFVKYLGSIISQPMANSIYKIYKEGKFNLKTMPDLYEYICSTVFREFEPVVYEDDDIQFLSKLYGSYREYSATYYSTFYPSCIFGSDIGNDVKAGKISKDLIWTLNDIYKTCEAAYKKFTGVKYDKNS